MAEVKKPYIGITKGMSGYFAVMYWWNPDMGGFWEPWSTGFGRYATEQEAIDEGKAWAAAEEVEFKHHSQ